MTDCINASPAVTAVGAVDVQLSGHVLSFFTGNMPGDSAKSLLDCALHPSLQSSAGRHTLRNPEDVLSGRDHCGSSTKAAEVAIQLMETDSNASDSTTLPTSSALHVRHDKCHSSGNMSTCTGYAWDADQKDSDISSHEQAADPADIHKPRQSRLLHSGITGHRQTCSQDDSPAQHQPELIDSNARDMADQSASSMVEAQTLQGSQGGQGFQETHREGGRQLKRAFSMMHQEDTSVNIDNLDSLDKVPCCFLLSS